MMSVYPLLHQSTSFVGREKELVEIATLLADRACRLLTLVGPGGIGKTRLALQVVADQLRHFADGVYFVPLAPVTSSGLLPSAIAGALEISFYGLDEPHVQLAHYLREKQILLVIDNFEHLLDGTGLLTELLQAAPGLKILATSRERLNLQEEWGFTLDGLSYPINSSGEAPENYSAVQLFVQRARQINNHFSFNENAASVQSICRQVEGMPLGLELAASWLRVLSCQQIADQIASRLDFLTTPLRNIPERHRSLRTVFEQSWHLLSSDEQAVLMKLSVFRGGFDLQAAEQVAGASLPLLSGLADKSLIRLNDSGRFDLHELLRQFSAEQLSNAGIATTITQEHIDYFLKLAEQAEAHLFGREQIVWFDRLEVDLDNLRAALARSTASKTGLQLAAALGWFFTERTYWNEGLTWLEQTLAANPDAPASLRAKSLHSAGALCGVMSNMQGARAYCEQALAIARTNHDDWNIAWSLAQWGTFASHDLKLSVAHLEESIALFRKLEDPMGLAHTLIRLSWKVFDRKDLAYARKLIDEAATLANQAGDTIMLGWASLESGTIVRQSGDLKEVKSLYERSILLFQQAHFANGLEWALILLADVELALGNLEHAQKLYKETLISNTVSLPDGNRAPIILAGLANVAKGRGQFKRAALLLATSKNEYLARRLDVTAEYDSHLSHIAEVRAKMGEKAFAEAWAAGEAMTRTQAITYALNDVDEAPEIPTINRTANQSLTDRELEILYLIADGLNSREIAHKLVLSVGTIRWYLKLIYSKLDAHSRSEAIAHAKTLKLLM